MIPAIDVSTWQPDQLRLGDSQVCWIRASVPAGKDAKYDVHAAQVKAAGIPQLAYAAVYPGDGAAQAATLLASVNADARGFAFDGREFGASDAEAKAFFAHLTAHDPLHRPTWQYQDYQHPYVENGAKHRWRARWGTQPPPDWKPGDFWQDRNVSTAVGDHDWFFGSASDLALLLGAVVPVPNRPPVDFGTPIHLVHAAYFHGIAVHAGATIYNPDGTVRVAKLAAPVTLAWIGASGTHYEVSDSSGVAFVLRTQGDPVTPASPIVISAGN
jgi:hypothetical protein